MENNEWKIDPVSHRRYRVIGHTREYETEVMINGISIPQSQIENFNKRTAALKEQENETNKKKTEQARICPLFASRMHGNCILNDCAFYTETGCKMANSEPRATEGKYCALTSRKCKSDCALYRDGCTY